MNATKDSPLKNALNSAGKGQDTTNKTVYNNESYKNVESRKGKKMIAGYFSPEMHKNLKLLAVQNDMPMQDVVHEALTDYLQAKGYLK